MIRISTCVIAALAFLAALFLVDCVFLLAFGWRNFGLIIPRAIFGNSIQMVIGYVFGLLRMRSIANQGRHETEEAEEMRHGATLPQRRYYDGGTWGKH